jgi:hypothetical protein
MESEHITTTDMWMGSIQMEIYWQRGAIALIKHHCMLQGITSSDPVQLADNLHRQIDKVILILQGIITKKILISYYIYLKYMTA